ncbi:MAG: lamin tail domain-containing protein [Phycisphaerae bacterium]|nr:lamin tail domain-containing protein [Phycisphaerae bacterium]
MRIYLFSLVIVAFLAGFAAAGLCPEGDLSGDCRVDWWDIKVFAEQWLNPGECEGESACANFDGLNGVDFADFAFLANYWLRYGPTLVINEFMASNNSDSNISDPYGDYDDWLEIYNYGNTPIDLAGMYLTDDLGDPTKWRIPTGYPAQTTVPANGFIVFWADGEPAEGPLHADFKLSADGEDILLSDANETLIDAISFGLQIANISYQRYPDGADNWQFSSGPTPGAQNNPAYLGEVEEVEFSHTRGFYDTSFNLTIACVTPGADIYYTTDGRNPIVGEAPSPTSIHYTSQIPIASTKYIRAAAMKPGWKPAKVETHTYIFNAPDDIKAMPVIAVVGDPTESLWAPNGIMCTSPINREPGYEKPVSVEILNADTGDNYQIDCGIRIHGNARYSYTIGEDWLTCWINYWDHQNMNKFSFRFYFRSTYGEDRFDYPLFPFAPEGEKKQAMVVRGGKNDSCTPFVKDEFSRRLFRFMGGVQLTGALVNLYINGVYKAYYNPCNRDNEQFFQEWYGSDNNFDVITQSGLRDGDTIAWDNFLNYVDTHDLTIPADYQYVADNLDIVQFIDFLIVEIHIGNFDWPNNNWTVHREKTDDGIFRFSIWDAEGIEQWYFGQHCEKCADTAFEDFPSYDTGTPKGLNNGPWPICRIYRKLKENPDFRQLFADRIHKHYKNDGIMMTDNLLTAWISTVNEVKPVLPVYDGVLPPSFVETVFLPVREPYVLAAFEDNDLYDSGFEAPTFYVNSSYQYGGYISDADTITITKPGSGTIYYTIDGNDPRVSFTGAISPSAIPYSGGFTLGRSTNLRARIYNSSTGQWSPLNEAVYEVGDIRNSLRITEIMYHPQDTGAPNDPDTEYVELKNISSSTINLNLVQFDKGIDFTFGPNSLTAGQHILVVKDKNVFEAKYGTGKPVAGQYAGSLDNGGERVRLLDATGVTILDFDYKDDWRSITDGDGYSLTIIEPTNPDTGSWDEKDSWRASVYVDGSPGADDSGIIPNPGAIVISEVMSHSHGDDPDWIELYNSTAGSINIGGWYLSDSDSNLLKYRFATGTTIPAHDYIVVYEDVNFGQLAADPGRLIPFALSKTGDTACLASALDVNGVPTGYRNKEDFGASETGVSFGRYYKASTDSSDFVAMDYNTPGSANTYPKVGSIVITEIMYHPDWPTNGSYTNDEYEYIELRNISGSAVTLYDSGEDAPWKFTDGVDFTFPASPNEVSIPAGGYILVVKNPAAFAWRYPGVPSGIVFGPYDGTLDNGGEKLELGKPGNVDEGVLRYINVERTNYSDGSHPEDCPGGVDLWPTQADGQGKSLTRTSATLYGNDPNNWTAATPTPGS